MAKKNKLELKFDDFLSLAEEVDNLGEGMLIKAVQNAAQKSKDYVNKEIEQALKSSKFEFNGQGASTGETLESLKEVSKMPVETSGTVVTAYAGVDLKDAPQALILAIEGSPHKGKDTKLSQAVRVKGKVRKEVNRIQHEEFMKVIEEGMHG